MTCICDVSSIRIRPSVLICGLGKTSNHECESLVGLSVLKGTILLIKAGSEHVHVLVDIYIEDHEI